MNTKTIMNSLDMAELIVMKWEYAVIEITNALFDTINELGDERWELCMKVDNRLIFKRPKLDAFENLAQERHVRRF